MPRCYHGDIFRLQALFDQLGDLRGHPVVLRQLAVKRQVVQHLGLICLLGHQLLVAAQAISYLRRNGPAGIQYIRVGAVILRQRDQLRLNEQLGKLGHVGHFGPLEGVDGLVVVANGHNVGPALVHRIITKRRQHTQLGLIGILEFIN